MRAFQPWWQILVSSPCSLNGTSLAHPRVLTICSPAFSQGPSLPPTPAPARPMCPTLSRWLSPGVLWQRARLDRVRQAWVWEKRLLFTLFRKLSFWHEKFDFQEQKSLVYCQEESSLLPPSSENKPDPNLITS